MILSYSNSPLIMGIVNVTPDSFSDGGTFANVHDAVQYASTLVMQGTDIIDIGGESTRPFADPVSAKEEISRVIPVISEIKQKHPDALISVDTYRSETAGMALEAGAKIINDISGGLFDPDIFACTAQYKAAYVAMHIKGNPKIMQVEPTYTDVVAEVLKRLAERAEQASIDGITEIIVDPGIGFGKSVQDNFQLLRSIPEFKKLGYPVLIGLSRKSFIGKTLDLEVQERDVPTAMLEMYCAAMGADIIRTHNVKHAMYLKKLFGQLQHD